MRRNLNYEKRSYLMDYDPSELMDYDPYSLSLCIHQMDSNPKPKLINIYVILKNLGNL